ncbi:hypothetical protein BDW74DRAFT_178326 [Aspergillus multicolor]|uniref:uncharacterized protein n=1 Tax=Aspergillus multicolor TaxID=41759 RepID=UPI003CCD3F8F
MRSLLIAPVALFALVASASVVPTSSSTSSILLRPLSARDSSGARCSLQSEFEGKQKQLKKIIKYIREVRVAVPELPAGKCEFVGCAGENHDATLVQWCNKSKETKRLPSWNNVADGAQLILDNCQRSKDEIQGYVDHNDKWRVAVFSKPCYKLPGTF